MQSLLLLEYKSLGKYLQKNSLKRIIIAEKFYPQKFLP